MKKTKVLLFGNLSFSLFYMVSAKAPFHGLLNGLRRTPKKFPISKHYEKKYTPFSTTGQFLLSERSSQQKTPILLQARNGVLFSPGHKPTLWVNGY